jgi:hypothetical protein
LHEIAENGTILQKKAHANCMQQKISPMSLTSLGLLVSFIGSILMLPESFRLSAKNKEGSISFISGYNSRMTGLAFVWGVALLVIGFGVQFAASVCGL